MKPLSRTRYVVSFLLVSLIYIVSGKLGLKLAFVHPSASPIWAPTGIALAAFLGLGYGIWPAIALSAFYVNLTTAGSVASSIGIAAGNTLEGLLGAYLINNFSHGRKTFDQSWDVIKFVLLAAFISTLISPTLGVTSLALWGFAPWASYGAVWSTWWSGDIGGNLIAAPLLILWDYSSTMRWNRAKVLEAILLVMCAAVFSLSVFAEAPFANVGRLPLAYVCFLPVIWAAYRFSQRETALTIVITCGIALWGTLHGQGPFLAAARKGSFLFMNIYMDVLSVTGLFIAAVMNEYREGQAALQRAHDDLELRVQERTISLANTISDLKNEIVQRREVERSLRESQERFRLLVDTAKDYAIFMLDAEGKVISWNPGAERIKGYKAEEIIGRHLSVFYTQADVEKGKPEHDLKKAVSDGRLEEISLRQRKDGSTFWADSVLTALFDKDGNHRGFAKITRDITERRQAEKKIQLYSDIVNSMQLGVGVLQLEELHDSKTLRLIAANPSASVVSGLPSGSAVGKTLWEALPDLYKTPLPKQLAEIVRSGRPIDFGEIHYGDERVKEGIFYIKAFPLPDHCVGVIFENVTARRLTEKALNESEERFRQLVNSNIIGFMLLDGTGRALEANDALLKVLGYAREDLVNGGLDEKTITPVQYHTIDQWMRERLDASGMCPPIEKEFVRKDGARIPVLVGMIQLHGTDGHRLCFVIDVTERRSAQDALRKAYDELETRVQQRTTELRDEISRREQAEEELRNQAIRDPLTGLYNRRGFMLISDPQLKLAERQKKRILLFMADLDDLKQINDNFGHAEGDSALTDAAGLLRKTFRESDIIARIGGDEFAITGLEEPGYTENELVNRLEKNIDDFNRYSGKLYRVHLSMGTARIPSDENINLEELMRQADAMLYEQKKQKNGSILKLPTA